MTLLTWGVVALVIAVICHFFTIFARTRAILGFVGTCIVTGGLFGSVLRWVVLHIQALTNTVTAKAFGTAIPGLIVIVLAFIFIVHLHPKGRGASRSTLFIGVALAACLVAGLSSWQALNNVPAGVRNGVSSTSVTGG